MSRIVRFVSPLAAIVVPVVFLVIETAGGKIP